MLSGLKIARLSSCVAVLVLALYLQSQEVTKLYSRPQLLWLVCPLVLYWNLRAWFIAQRGEMPDDPMPGLLQIGADLVEHLVVGVPADDGDVKGHRRT